MPFAALGLSAKVIAAVAKLGHEAPTAVQQAVIPAVLAGRERRHRLVIPREQLAGFERTEVPSPVLDPHGGIKGKHKSKKDKLREAAALAARTGRPHTGRPQ